MKQFEKKQKLKWLYHCPECLSSNTYYRRKTDDFVCRKCGWTFKKAIVRKESED